MRTGLRWILSCGLSLVIFFVVTRNYSLSELGPLMQTVGWGIVLAGIAFRYVNYLIGGLRWKVLYPHYPFWISTNGTIISVAASAVIPARGGEIVRALYMKDDKLQKGSAVIAGVVVERLLDAMLVLSLLGYTLFSLTQKQAVHISQLLIPGACLVAGFITGLFLYVRFCNKIDPWMAQFATSLNLPQGLRDRGRDFLAVFKQIEFGRLIGALFLTVVITFAGVFNLWIWFQACDLKVSMYSALLIYPLITLSISVPVTVSHVGVYHAAMIYALALVGVEGSDVVGKVILVHLFAILPTAIYGWILIGMKKYKFKSAA